jgi:hypothetical protein
MALSTLFGEDLAGRWKIISITATVVAVSGFATDWLTGSVPTAQLVSSSLGLLVFAAFVLGYYTRRSHQASADNRDGEQSQLAFTGRRYWIFAIESATILAVADFISIIKRAGTQRVIDISLMVSARAASALDDFANKKTPSADVKALAYLADSSVRFFQERKMPSTVVGAALTARAAFLVSEFPAVARNSDRNLALDLNGNVSRAAIHTGQDDFISNVRIFSSVANSHVDVVGILVDGEPNVVAFRFRSRV